MYPMNKKQEVNRFVKECITTALVQMMETRNLEEISVTELVERAGVSRNSFYRNFQGKRDILAQHLTLLIQEWGREFEARGDINAFAETLLCHYDKYKDFYLLLYRQGLSDMIYETIRGACRVTEAESGGERYRRSMFAGLVFGWLDEWLRRGMAESAEEMARLLKEKL